MEIGHTRRVTTYGRRARNFVKVWDEDLIPSPVRKATGHLFRSPSVESLSPSESIDLRTPPHISSSRSGNTNGGRIASLSNENKTIGIAPPRHRQSSQHANPVSTPKVSPATRRRLEQQEARAKALSRITNARNRKPLGSMVPTSNGMSPIAVKTPAKRTSRKSSYPTRASDTKSIEIIVLDQDGTEISHETRTKKMGESPGHAILVDEVEEVLPVRRISPKKRSRIIVISSDEEEEDDNSTKNTIAPLLALQTKLAAKGSSDIPPVRPHAAVNERPVGAPLPSPTRAILSQGPKRSSDTSSQSQLSARSRDALLKLPPDVLSSVAATGSLESALPHLSPSTRQHVEEHLSGSQKLPGPPLDLSLGSMQDSLFECESDGDAEVLQVENILAGLNLESQVDRPDDEDGQGLGGELDSNGSAGCALGSPELPNAALNLLESSQPPSQMKGPPFRRLLKLCSQKKPMPFDSFVTTFPLDEIHGPKKGNGKGKPLRFRKIGEASFSEVFAIGDVVVKVVPLQTEDAETTDDEEDEAELPCLSVVSDVENEILVTHEMGEAHDGFVKLIKTCVVKGSYPKLLLDLWDEYEEAKGSENIRPDVLPPSTHYALIILPNAGIDLESYSFPPPSSQPWKNAFSIVWQLVRALAVAEECNQFEHRDLHWGQVLIKDAPDSSMGATVTIIDFGLSRMDGLEQKVYTEFEESIFEGRGDYQFEIYRMMREHNGNSWEPFCPLTNVMWLHYLVDKITNFKGLAKPVIGKTSRATKTPAQLRKEEEKEWYDKVIETCQYLASAVQPFLESSTVVARKKSGRSRGTAKLTGPTRAAYDPPNSAVDVLRWMVERSVSD